MPSTSPCRKSNSIYCLHTPSRRSTPPSPADGSLTSHVRPEKAPAVYSRGHHNPSDVDRSSPGLVRNLRAGELDLRRSPRRGSKQPGHEDTFASDDADADTPAPAAARSTSPVKNLDDLLKLKKPFSFMTPDPRTLRDVVKATGSAPALRLFDDIWTIIQGVGYLPWELKVILKGEVDGQRL